MYHIRGICNVSFGKNQTVLIINGKLTYAKHICMELFYGSISCSIASYCKNSIPIQPNTRISLDIAPSSAIYRTDRKNEDNVYEQDNTEVIGINII